MNARIASVDICYPNGRSEDLKGFRRPLPITLKTENLRLELIQAGPDYGAALPGVHPAVDEKIMAGIWAVFTHRNDPLGVIALDAPPLMPDFECYYGPHLNIACRRDNHHAPYVPEAIDGLFNWLRVNHICFAIHADHADSDQQLADWLIGAGFLYTGRHSADGRHQMICLL